MWTPELNYLELSMDYIKAGLLKDAKAAFTDAAPFAHHYLGNLLYDKKQYEKAIELLTETFTYPDNLGEGKLPNVLGTWQ